MKGPSYWKMNVSHLSSRAFVEGINKLIERQIDKEKSNPIRRWEGLKFEISKFAREYSIIQAQKHRERIKELEKKMTSYNKALNMINLKSQYVVKAIEKLNYKIDAVKVELERKQDMKFKELF